ncbi:MAG: heavy metal sensor histidine kinase [Limisphaerales bacterium]
MSWKSDPNEAMPRRGRVGHWSIARRLTLLYAGWSMVMLVLAAAYLYWSLVGDVSRDDNAFLANRIQECRRLLRDGPQDAPLLAHEIQTEAGASQFIRYFVRLLDERGQIALETPGMSALLPASSFPMPIDTHQPPTRGRVWKTATGVPYSLMAARAQTTDATGPKTLQVALDVTSDEALLAGYRWKLLFVVLSGVVFSCAAGVLVAGKGLRPLQEITQATERITASQLHDRIVTDGWPDELASLARSFDRMLDRLEDSFRRLSQFSADLAHELRTPVNNLRGEAGVALSKARTAEEYRRTLESSLEELARLTRLIDNMLFLARADGAGVNPLARSSFDARKEIEAVCEFYRALAEDRGVAVSCEGAGVAGADPMLFRQAVSNLLSNALNYTPHGGRVVFQLREREDHGLEVCTRDTGCGIAPEHLPRIFDRLYRVDSSRSQHPNGAGLGLAIVKSIMTLHQGAVEAQSTLGQGTTITLSFPPRRAEPPQS